ncbi:MAG: c-type cytochrome [Rhodothermales bacterium]|nr:c-type cytochrome [Rhodothermales bacterium]
MRDRHHYEFDEVCAFCGAAAVILLAALIGLSTASSQLANAQNVDLGTDAQREAGRVIYNDKCAHCHGINGDADAVGTPFFRPGPRDFTAGVFKFRTTASGELPTDDDIRRSIREGMPYTGMPAWPSLSEQQVTNLMYYIKTFNEDFAGPYGEVTPIEIPDPPRVSDESIARGREVYMSNQCFDCHGDQGRGDGDSAPGLTNDWGEPIRAADLTKRWTFRGGSTRRDIYRTFTTGLDGSPMPSYDIQPPEDQWALVDYVYSLSRDEADYATVVTAVPADTALDLSAGRALFSDAPAALLPVVGQVIEPGRQFFPGVNAIEARAVFTDDEIAWMLSWHNMSAQVTGRNAPDLAAPLWSAEDDTTELWSDAVALQFPTRPLAGNELPYLVFGDSDASTDLWFADLAADGAAHFTARGSENMTAEGPVPEMMSVYEDGRWTVVFKRDRIVDERVSFEEGTFVPVAFSVWDGFNRERGNRRGMTSWYYTYVQMADRPSPVGPMLAYGFATLFVGLGLTFFMRRRVRRVPDDDGG